MSIVNQIRMLRVIGEHITVKLKTRRYTIPMHMRNTTIKPETDKYFITCDVQREFVANRGFLA